MPSQSLENRRRAGNAYYHRNGNASLYGLTPADYAELLAAQNSVCAICGEPEVLTYRGRLKRLSVDHCHDTDEIRGLLCNACNTAIGMLRHDPALVEKARLYLLR